MAKEETTEGITVKKSKDFSEWYNQVVVKAKLANFTSVKGFMTIMPNGYEIWENIQEYLNKRIKKLGHRNAYAPAVIPESFLKKEKEHIENFSGEAFWVTREGPEELKEWLALRPTSETIIYDSYSKWIRSWRDLPVLYNYWNSVFRYETKMTKLFIRTREFLWQEGHTVHRTKEEADKEVYTILDTYKDLVQDLLAIPVLTGLKTDKERFAGALYTTTIEAMMPNGKALQMGTSHNLGQNFSMPFGIKFLDKDKTEKYAWQTCWGVSTRLIGAVVMVHGDDKGLILPPKVAPTQIVIVPIIFENSKKKVLESAEKVGKELQKKFRVKLDNRDNYSAGWKFNHWELLGIPLRIEVGPKDVAKKQVVLVRRDTGNKEVVKVKDLNKVVKNVLDGIQDNLFNKAKKELEKSTTKATTFSDLKKLIGKGGFIKAGWCGNTKCEDKVQDETTATIRLIPFDEKAKGSCACCGEKAKHVVYFAKSY